MKLDSKGYLSFFQSSQKLTVLLILIASALVFKSCDSGDVKDDRSKSNTVSGEEEGDEEGETGAAPNEAGSDVPDSTKTVYTLKIDLEAYADTDVTALRFYLAEKSAANQTFLKEVATPAGFDFTKPTVSFSSKDLESIDDYVDAEACVTVKAVRVAIESEESEPFCFSDW